MTGLTDTEILDFLEKSIASRQSDSRWPTGNYMVHIGCISFSLGPKQPLSFRELVTQAYLGQITDRLKK